MIRSYFDGVPPRTGLEDEGASEVPAHIAESKRRFDEEFDALNFSRALEAAWAGIARVDKFITENQPWKLAKDSTARPQLERVLATAYEALRHLVLLVAPALPVTSREIWSQMGLARDPLRINPNEVSWGEAIAVSDINRISPTFPKLDKEKIMAEIENESTPPAVEATSKQQPEQPAAVASESPAASTAHITIDDFIKVELRAATVLEAEKVPKADKLLRLVVDLGEPQPRQILAGIAQHYSPEDVIGRKIIVVANLAPRKLRGLESNGMLLAASVGEDGRPVLATFGEDVPNGTQLK